MVWYRVRVSESQHAHSYPKISRVPSLPERVWVGVGMVFWFGLQSLSAFQVNKKLILNLIELPGKIPVLPVQIYIT